MCLIEWAFDGLFETCKRDRIPSGIQLQSTVSPSLQLHELRPVTRFLEKITEPYPDPFSSTDISADFICKLTFHQSLVSPYVNLWQIGEGITI